MQKEQNVLSFKVFRHLYVFVAWAYGLWLYRLGPHIDGIQFSALSIAGTALFLTILTELYDVRPKSDLTRNRVELCYEFKCKEDAKRFEDLALEAFKEVSNGDWEPVDD